MSLTAVFGGTFNPFHIGHYEILKALCKADFIDEVLLVPDKIPPHKCPEYMASDKDRIEMCRIAAEEFKKVKVCLIEFEREGKSYTLDTVLELKKRFPNKNFAVVCGGDMILSLTSWHEYSRLKKETSFIAFNRNNDKSFEETVKALINDGAEIIVMDNNINSVSSTELRKKLSKDLIPRKIYEYILKKGIYNER